MLTKAMVKDRGGEKINEGDGGKIEMNLSILALPFSQFCATVRPFACQKLELQVVTTSLIFFRVFHKQIFCFEVVI